MQQSGGDLIVGEVSWQRIVPPTAPNLEESGCEKQFVLFLFLLLLLLFLFSELNKRRRSTANLGVVEAGPKSKLMPRLVFFFGPCMLPTDERLLSSTDSSGRGFHRLSAVGNIMGRGAVWEMKSHGLHCSTLHPVNLPPPAPCHTHTHTHTAEEKGQLTDNEGDLLSS